MPRRMPDEQKPMQFSIEDGPTFYADEISVLNNESRIFLDFKNSSPRIDVRSNESLPIAIKHDMVVMDPGLAKVFSKLLQDHIKKYEKEYGKIKEPKTAKSPVKTSRAKDDKPGYFG